MISVAHANNNVDVAQLNPIGTIYVSGDANTPGSWRLQVKSSPIQLVIEHREALIEEDITLTEAKVGQIRAAGHTSSSPFFGSVLDDVRVSQAVPPGINGDMTSRIVRFDGFVWNNSLDEWFDKANFEQSLSSDRGIFRRMNVIDTDPNEKTQYPPIPLKGTSLGARNSLSDGSGGEMLSFNNKDGFFGMIEVLVHGNGAGAQDQLFGLLANGTPVGSPYELAHLQGTVYFVGDTVIDRGRRYRCNTEGLQVGIFSDEVTKWDVVSHFPIDRILVDNDGSVLTDNGNVLLDY